MLAAFEAKNKGSEIQAQPASETSTVSAKPQTPTEERSEDPAAPEKKTDSAPQDSPYSLDEENFTGARDLAGKIDANDALKIALPADLRNEIMANARLAERGAEYEKIFASPGEAQTVVQSAQEFAGYQEAFSMVGSDAEKGTTAMIHKLLEASALRDKDGNPQKRQDGSFVTDGTASKFLTTVANRWFGMNVVDKVKALGDENVQAALDLVMESVGMRPSTAAKTENQDPALDARKAELDAQEARLNQERQERSKADRQAFETARDTEITSAVEGEVKSLLDLATGLDEFTRTSVEEKLWDEIRSAIKSNTAYQMRRTRIQSQPMTAERRQQEVNLARQFMREHLARIARPILTKAGAIVEGKLQQRQAAQSARAQAARSEVGGAAPPAPSATGPNANPAQQIAQARDEFKRANGGKDPTDSELNIFMMLNHAKSRGIPVAA